jgi:hypothetical protein
METPQGSMLCRVFERAGGSCLSDVSPTDDPESAEPRLHEAVTAALGRNGVVQTCRPAPTRAISHSHGAGLPAVCVIRRRRCRRSQAQDHASLQVQFHPWSDGRLLCRGMTMGRRLQTGWRRVQAQKGYQLGWSCAGGSGAALRLADVNSRSQGPTSWKPAMSTTRVEMKERGCGSV